MTNLKVIIVSVVAAVLVSLAATAVFFSGSPETPASTIIPVEYSQVGAISMPTHNTPEAFINGVSLDGTMILFTQSIVIPAGSNQASWRNRTGRIVYVNPEDTFIGYDTGTASTSLAFYVATSSASTISTDFAHPGGSIFGVNGAISATSTIGPTMYSGTTTNSGLNIPVPDGAYLVFQVQQTYGCKAIGGCETATSTSRGISTFRGWFRGQYRP